MRGGATVSTVTVLSFRLAATAVERSDIARTGLLPGPEAAVVGRLSALHAHANVPYKTRFAMRNAKGA